MEKAFKIYIKSERLPFALTEVEKTIKKENRNSLLLLSQAEKSLQLFLRKLEKKIPGVIWYIGTDLIEDKICERFMFSKGGFMEISIEKSSEITAFFPNEKQAKKFGEAVKKIVDTKEKNIYKLSTA